MLRMHTAAAPYCHPYIGVHHCCSSAAQRFSWDPSLPFPFPFPFPFSLARAKEGHLGSPALKRGGALARGGGRWQQEGEGGLQSGTLLIESIVMGIRTGTAERADQPGLARGSPFPLPSTPPPPLPAPSQSHQPPHLYLPPPPPLSLSSSLLPPPSSLLPTPPLPPLLPPTNHLPALLAPLPRWPNAAVKWTPSPRSRSSTTAPPPSQPKGEGRAPKAVLQRPFPPQHPPFPPPNPPIL